MSDDRLADWKLVIVGSGSDENNYKSYVAENDIKNIYFEGNKNPLPYYQKASVFLMTSALESWGADHYGSTTVRGSSRCI